MNKNILTTKHLVLRKLRKDEVGPESVDVRWYELDKVTK